MLSLFQSHQTVNKNIPSSVSSGRVQSSLVGSSIQPSMEMTTYQSVLRTPYSLLCSHSVSFEARVIRGHNPVRTICCLNSNDHHTVSVTLSSSSEASQVGIVNPPLPVLPKRKKVRKQYPGESKGITEEMRFVAMRLRNVIENKDSDNERLRENGDDKEEGKRKVEEDENLRASDGGDGGNGEISWQPKKEGFLKYLVDSKLVFNTIERIIDESSDASYLWFRKTGLERSAGLSKDLEWFSQQGDVIPEPSKPGITYAKYLEELAANSVPSFLSHIYNIYFSHIAGGQVIAKKVSEKLLDGRELEFNKWERDEQELLKDVRQKLNMLGEHWSRDDKNKCLKEATKSFKCLGQIVRLIIA